MKTFLTLLLLVSLFALASADCSGGTECLGGCCPYPQAVCCPSGSSCCPGGTTCYEAQGICVRQFNKLLFKTLTKLS
ncbi:hypothetical protein QR680_008241 [Steinernema hermaphroditum]|uniref:Granulins domain-containing protein n=1 Tax=Steinernema hermaphroditum TaxID=289476 RepID=A0AA39IHF3_9BILA|nr:hypothetical protein QR680_008241 [Steinernema hermaphroditum]